MKILLAHNFYRSSAPSGEDGVYHAEAKLLEDHGHEVVRFEKYNDDLDEGSLAGRLRLGLDTAWSNRAYSELSAVIRATRPDIAHFHNTFPQLSPSVYQACQDHGVPVVQTLHNFRLVCPNAMLLRDNRPCERCLGTNLLAALRYRCYRGSLAATAAQVWMLTRNRVTGSYQRLVNRYIALTDFAAGRLIAGGLPPDRLVVKPNFIDPIAPVAEARQPYAIYVGRLKSEKGVRTLVAAWRHIEKLPLKIVGDGELRGELEAQVKADGSQVEFCGYRARAEVMSLVAQARLQVVPSECYEGFPLVILEAYACGTPVLAAAIGSLQELVTEGATGRKFRSGDAADLAAKLHSMLADPQELAAMGRRAREQVLELYTAEQNYAQLMDIYQQVQAETATTPSSRRNDPVSIREEGQQSCHIDWLP